MSFKGDKQVGEFCNALGSMSTAGANLERLAIRVPLESHGSDRVSQKVGTSLQQVRFAKLTELKEFKLVNVGGLDHLIDPLDQLIPYEKLLRLNVSNCSGSDEFCSSLGKRLKAADSHLQHLFLSGQDEDESCYLDLLDSCQRLSSLHISQPNWMYTPILQKSLLRLGPSLDTLALHEELVVSEMTGWTQFSRNKSPHMSNILPSCSNVRFLGYQIAEKELDVHRGREVEDIATTLVSDPPCLILRLECTHA
jgi:hypothetical protein